MECNLSKRVEEVAEAAYILSEVLAEVSIDFGSINKARALLFNPAQPQENIERAENSVSVAGGQGTANTGSPKLPTLAECLRYFDIPDRAFGVRAIEVHNKRVLIEECYDYICRQLRAGA